MLNSTWASSLVSFPAGPLALLPSILVADEPTGNLDSQTAEFIVELLRQLHTPGLTVLLVTYNLDLARRADRVIHLNDGHLVS